MRIATRHWECTRRFNESFSGQWRSWNTTVIHKFVHSFTIWRRCETDTDEWNVCKIIRSRRKVAGVASACDMQLRVALATSSSKMWKFGDNDGRCTTERGVRVWRVLATNSWGTAAGAANIQSVKPLRDLWPTIGNWLNSNPLPNSRLFVNLMPWSRII